MYVSALDRPWLDTPFLFQGFHIESEEVIDELRAHCEHVYIDIAKCDNSIVVPRNWFAENGKTPKNTKKSLEKSGAKGPFASAQQDDPLDATHRLKIELPDARKAHIGAEVAVRELFSKVRHGTAIDVESMHASVDPMIDSIMRNDDAMSWLARMKKKNDYVYDHSISSSVWALNFWKAPRTWERRTADTRNRRHLYGCRQDATAQ